MKEKSNKKMMILSFIGIILVVIGHTDDQFAIFNNIFPYYSFHMPLFIFISGYFYKESNEKNLKNYILSKFKKLVIPYFFWNIIYGLILTVSKSFHLVNYGENFSFYSVFISPWLDGRQFPIYIAPWFMLALFLVCIIYIALRALLKKIRIWNDIVAAVLLFLICFFSIKYSGNANYYLISLLRIGFFLFFYHIGYMYKKYEDKIKINTVIKLLSLFLIQITILKIDSSIIYFSSTMIFFSKYTITPILTSMTGILLWLTISEILVPSLGNKKIVNYISCHTKEIMMHHMFWIFIINLTIKMLAPLLGLAGFDNDAFASTIYYFYTAGIPQFSIIYTIICITMPLLCHYVYKKYMVTIFKKTIKKIKK